MTLIHLALRQAITSSCRHRVGAVIAAGSRVLAAAPNRHRNSPTVDFRHATFHAEEATLRRVRYPSGATIYVARVSAVGMPAMARPCSRCQKALMAAGIVRAYYTEGDGKVGILDLVSASVQ
ncbi:hypothetical protein [Streptomyces sp. NPDC053431]|uniref:hypothetical protein n=1 Tax=Streptomyces sp. NPDC053431 TaxID=3365703 RepID=UPI0037D6A5B3